MDSKSKKNAVVDTKYCVACGCCVSICPLSAIEINQGSFAMINLDKCVGCGKCSAACPASVIKIRIANYK